MAIAAMPFVLGQSRPGLSSGHGWGGRRRGPCILTQAGIAQGGPVHGLGALASGGFGAGAELVGLGLAAERPVGRRGTHAALSALAGTSDLVPQKALLARPHPAGISRSRPPEKRLPEQTEPGPGRASSASWLQRLVAGAGLAVGCGHQLLQHAAGLASRRVWMQMVAP